MWAQSVVSLRRWPTRRVQGLQHPFEKGETMSDHVYQLVELVGSSSSSSDDAIRNAIAQAAASTKHIGWFEVVQTRGHVVEGKVAHFQVTLKVGYRMGD